jgi:hypothetical protein
MQEPGPPGWENLKKLRKSNMVMSSAELRPEKDSTGEEQRQLKTTDPTSRQRERSTSTNP